MLIFFLHFYLLFNGHFPKPLAFTSQTIDDKVSIGYGLAIGDVDGDKKPDILLADKKQFVWYRNGDWKRFVMVDSLTTSDNVCITARDLDGDGKVEVAVGAQWNPGETTDSTRSGSVHYLVRPADPTQRWKAVQLPHEPTVHRMKWLRSSDGKYFLIVAPLHGRGNRGGEGAGVKLLAYEFPSNVSQNWRIHLLDSSMHLTHNFEVTESPNKQKTELLLAGKEGIKLIREPFNNRHSAKEDIILIPGRATGEIRRGRLAGSLDYLACIEPMHGNQLTVHVGMKDHYQTVILDDNIREGHALAVADFTASGRQQVVMGWRLPNKDGKVGIKMYASKDAFGNSWEGNWIDENGMACEDLQVNDMNGDGKPDIIAAGRATHNLVIYWNK
jgi:hypothetical protein